VATGSTFPSISYPGSNINVDPQFCYAAPAPLAIDPNSPCIDAGLDLLVPNDNSDVDDDGVFNVSIPWDRIERQRLFDTVAGGELVEMGAYEVARNDNCPLDVNGDGAIGLTDMSILLIHFGETGLGTCTCAPADFNCDGNINLTDLSMLLAAFGSSCEESFMGGGGHPDIPDQSFIEWAREASLEELMAWNAEWLGSAP